MREYFEAEMRLLRESAQEFAEAYPELAAQLNLKSLRDWDPHVERLLEGTAYLTAQIQQRIDDDIPEICETFLMQLSPHFLRPFPAATIMQFQPKPGQLQKPYDLPKKTTIKSSAVGDEKNKIVCEFQTCSSIKINPIQISQVNMHDDNSGGSILTLKMQTTGATFEKLDLQELVIYLHGEAAISLQTYYALLAETSEITVSFPEQPNCFPQKIREKLTPSNFSFLETLTPISGKSSMGFHLLQEYFAFRNKYFFVTLNGLEKIIWPIQCQTLELSIKLKTSFSKDFRLTENYFLLNCVPAINLFEMTCEPIKLTARRSEYPIIPDANQQENILLYSVDKVTAVADDTGKRQEYSALNSFLFRRTQNNYYHVTQRNNDKKYPKTFLIMGGINELQNETLSCNITALNGHHSRDFLAENSLTMAKSLPDSMHSHNILRPSRMLMPPQREQFRWILISHLAVNLQTIIELNKLKEVLAFYDWSGRTDNQRRIEGITAFTVKPIRQIQQGALVQGLEFNLIVKEDFYFSIGDIYLFGWVLHNFFINYVPINMITVTKLKCLPATKEFIWQNNSVIKK